MSRKARGRKNILSQDLHCPHLPEHECRVPSSLDDIFPWALLNPLLDSLWGAISGCPTENPVIGRGMSSNEASGIELVSMGIFPAGMGRSISVVCMDRGLPKLPSSLASY